MTTGGVPVGSFDAAVSSPLLWSAAAPTVTTAAATAATATTRAILARGVTRPGYARSPTPGTGPTPLAIFFELMPTYRELLERTRA